MKSKKTHRLLRTISAEALSALMLCSAAPTFSAASVYGSDTDVTAAAAASGRITLSKTALTVARGNTAALTVKFSDSVKTKITQSSSNKAVCTVSDGVITARAAGTSVITAKTPDGRTAKCTVTVVVKPTKIKLDKTSASVYKGSTLALNAAVYPSSTTNKTVKWISSKPSVATVSSSGIVTGVSKGKTTITAFASNGIKTTAVITVIVPAAGISFKTKTADIGVGEQLKLTPSLTPAASNDTISWKSSNTAAAVVNNGVVTAKKAGTAVITASIPNGRSAMFTVYVKNAPSKVLLAETDIDMGTEETHLLSVKLPDGSASYNKRRCSPSLACRLGRCFCLRQRCPPDTRTL